MHQLSVIFLVVLCSQSLAQTPRPITKHINEKATCSVIGTVFDIDTKELLPNIEVILQDTDLSAITDSNGHYEIHSIPKRRFIVQTISRIYKSKKEHVYLAALEKPNIIDFGLKTKYFTIIKEKTKVHKNPCTIIGYVVDKYTKEPLCDAELYFRNIERKDTTDILGKFMADNIPAGVCTIDTRLKNYRLARTVIFFQNDISVVIKLEPDSLIILYW